MASYYELLFDAFAESAPFPDYAPPDRKDAPRRDHPHLGTTLVQSLVSDCAYVLDPNTNAKEE